MKIIEDSWEAIKLLQVRGAPAIGIFAGYSLALFHGNDIEKAKEYLDRSRPTAVNLSWATARMVNAYKTGKNLIEEAIAIHDEDIKMCRKIVAGKDIVTSQTTQVFSNDHVYLSSLYVGDHALEIRTVEICSGPTIVNIGVVDAKTVLLNELIEQRLLVVDALGRALALILL